MTGQDRRPPRGRGNLGAVSATVTGIPVDPNRGASEVSGVADGVLSGQGLDVVDVDVHHPVSRPTSVRLSWRETLDGVIEGCQTAMDPRHHPGPASGAGVHPRGRPGATAGANRPVCATTRRRPNSRSGAGGRLDRVRVGWTQPPSPCVQARSDRPDGGTSLTLIPLRAGVFDWMRRSRDASAATRHPSRRSRRKTSVP